MSLTLKRLRQVLDYNSETGIFTWKIATSSASTVGSIAGSIDDGYRRITIDGERNFAHRLAWWYVTGKKPTKIIDHINGIRDDNSISNLRQCTNSQNNQNMVCRGYYYDKTSRKYRAKIRVNGKTYSLGNHDTAHSARDAYLTAKSTLHKFNPIPRNL